MRFRSSAWSIRLGARVFWTLLFGAALTACGGHEEPAEDGEHSQIHTQPQGPKPQLGLMTSLPLYWPIDADFGDLASGSVPIPSQRAAFEKAYELVPLDTLSPIAPMTQGEPDKDPLGELTRLAVIQPRVLTPSDNVALDDWVHGGGRLLLVLDPALAGHYPLPLGDPRRPVEAALIPPVLARWGLAIQFDEAQETVRKVDIEGTTFPTMLSGEIGEIGETGGSVSDCRIMGEGLIAQCSLGKGTVTLVADAQVFKGDQSPHQSPKGLGSPTTSDNHDHQHSDGHGDEVRSKAIQMLIRLAFETE